MHVDELGTHAIWSVWSTRSCRLISVSRATSPPTTRGTVLRKPRRGTSCEQEAWVASQIRGWRKQSAGL